MARASKTNVGVIGLGIIGSRVASNLRAKGFQSWVWNRSPRPEPNFLSSPQEVAESARVIQIFVSDGQALLDTIIGMSPALGPEHVILNHATVSPAETREAARLVQDRHARFLDAPFTGSRDAAAAGELVYFVGGSPEALEAARPVLESSAKTILPLGGVGDATAIKIATNVIAASTVTALAEAMGLLAKHGVALQNFLEVLPHHGIRSGLVDMKTAPMVLDDFEPRFALKHMFKDVQIALNMASEAGIELPAASAFAGAAMAAMQQGHAEKDFSAIAKLYGYPDKDAPVDEKHRPQVAPKPGEAPANDRTSGKRWTVFGAKKS